MLITTKAIVISAMKYAEADLIVRCFTLSNGLKTYLLRNILKSKKGKLKSSMFQPLTQLEIVAMHKNKGSLESIREAKIINAYQTLHTNIYKSSMAIFLAEMIKNAIMEEETNEGLYYFLEESFNWLEFNEHVSNFHLIFLLKLTKYLGFYPQTPNGKFHYFNMLDGTFQSMETNNYCIANENFELLIQLLGTNFEDQKNIKLNQDKRSRFLNTMLVYYDLQLQNFKKPKSLAVLNEIFS